MRSMVMPSRSHHTESLERLNNPLGDAKGTPLAVGAPGRIREPLQSTFLIALEDLIAGFARDPELPAQRGHAFAVLEPNYESHAFVHNRTFLPWHSTHPPSGQKV